MPEGILSGDSSRLKLAAFIFVLLFNAVVLGHFHDRFWWGPDDGADAHVAARILDGEVLNRNVQDIHPGYSNFMNALALKIFGHDVVSLRYPHVLVNFLQSCLIFILVLPRGALLAAAAAAGATAVSFIQYLHPSPHWVCLLLFFVIAYVLNRMAPGSRRRLEILGFLLVLMLLFRQLTGIFVAMGVLCFLLTEKASDADDGRRNLARAIVAIMTLGLGWYLATRTSPGAILMYGLWPMGIIACTWRRAELSDAQVISMIRRLALGGIVAALPFILYYLIWGSAAGLYHDAVTAALAMSSLDFIFKVSYAVDLVIALRQIVIWEGPVIALNGLYWIALLLAPLMLGYLVLRRVILDKRMTVHPLAFLGVFYTLVALHFQTPIYFYFAFAAPLVGFLWLASGSEPWRQGAMTAFAALIVVMSLYFQAGQPATRGIDGALRGERGELAKAEGIDGLSLWIEPADIELYRILLGLIEENVTAEETIFALPQNSELYFLSGRRNPFRFYNSGFGVISEADLQQVLKTIENDPPKLVFFRPVDKYNTSASARIMEAVRANYDHLATQGEIEVYRAREGAV